MKFAAVLGVVARLDPGVDQRNFVVVYIESRGMLCSDHELVRARIGRSTEPSQAIEKSFGFELFGVGARSSPNRNALRVGPFELECIAIEVAHEL